MSEFDRWWNSRGEVVEPFNKRRGGESGVERINDPSLGTLYVKRQIGHKFRSLRYPLGKPTAIRERDVYLALGKIGIKTPELIFVEAQKLDGAWRAILVTKELTGFSNLLAWYKSGGRNRLGPENHRLFLEKLGQTLALLHRNRWCHNCLHFMHIFVTPGTADQLPEIALLDLEKAKRKPTRQRAAKRDFYVLKKRAPVINGAIPWNDDDWSILLKAHQQALN